MREMNEQEIKALNAIALNEPIMASELTRRLWGMGISGKEKDDTLRELMELGLIKTHRPRFRIRKSGPPPTMFEATNGGHQFLEDYIEQQNSLGAA